MEGNLGTDGTHPGFFTPPSRKKKLVNVPSVPNFRPPSILKDSDVAFRACFGGLRWHMSSRRQRGSFVQLRPAVKSQNPHPAVAKPE